MRLSRFVCAGLTGIFLTTTAAASAATFTPHVQNPVLDHAYHPPLALLDDAIEHGPYLPFFSSRELDRLKTEAAMKGLVVMAATSVTGTPGKTTTKSRAMIDAESAIYDRLMWLCAGLQRERI